ncbi:hypothetical protein A2866_04920 [Candidatus Roizmanbacteria bacterium RIFCSPHIGHO2_01_FULL_39_8]|uniref:Glycosyltransferase RgtA/B/C/D-like domain-containing protein n=1 Tax=Candidatus Roizmanbacteria bacterium RIFCSPHIGHO2_01_FULL_39_8 TaxID=1802033 RepID=A0A1F7GPW4_9BACT|nr:MAG: hypothetical protein A2866_04920 [Candidatus Roizmanbacteria bacterium RIFCSPHIGHO2_01_FULL_39_8]
MAFLFIFFNLVLAAWSVLHKDIYYYTDIGRDFLIFDEIATKKLVLIGPRADAQGLFHGVLWHYLNMPAYLIGNGNPIIVGWFWILLTVGFLASVYFIMKRLFDSQSALIATLLLSFTMVPIAQGFFHGNGAMLLLPLFLYFFIRYEQTAKLIYLIGHFFIGGMLLQFEIALGLPLLLLSTLAAAILVIRKKKYIHFVGFAVLLLFFLTFLVSDLRHNFLQFRSLIAYAKGARDGKPIPLILSLKDRLEGLSTVGLNFVRSPLHKFNLVVFIFMTYCFYGIFKKKDRKRSSYLIFLYFYIGYYALTLLHGGFLIMFWWLPMSVLPILIFSTLHRYSLKWLYYGLLFTIIVISGIQNTLYISKITIGFGTANGSWRFHLTNANKIFADAPGEFGYFIYAPDIFGYQDKYAMSYAEKLSSKKASRFIKKQTTYVLIEPPPSFRPDLMAEPWIKRELGINSSPVKIIPLSNGYQINKYNLSKSDREPPAKITPNDWLFFR